MKLSALALAGVLLAGCTAAPAVSPTPAPASSAPASSVIPTPTEDSPSPTPTPTSTEPETSERGNTIKKVGQVAQLVDGHGDLAVTFTVTKIERNFKCTSGYADKSKHGHYVGVWMKIQTTKAIDFDSDDAGVVPYFNPGDWQVVGPDGTTENDSEGNGYSCARDSDALPSQLGPGKKVSGVMVLDTKYKSGHLVLLQDYMETGWEWAF